MIEHTELCKLTAKWSITPPEADWLALYEYQSFATQEFPDVLTYHCNKTTLYEIKTSHSDFLADLKKTSRARKADYTVYSGIVDNLHKLTATTKRLEKQYEITSHTAKQTKTQIAHLDAVFHCYRSQDKSYQEAPHLGNYRYYVCEPGIIVLDEVPEGWGLLYYINGKFRKMKKSSPWKANVKDERDIIAHALRRFASGDQTGIMVHTY
jgi:hypothetical protein